MQTFGAYNGYLASTDQSVIATTIADASLLEKTFQVGAGNGLAQREAVHAAAALLPENPAAVQFISIEGIVGTLASMGMPMQPQQALEPIALGLALDGRSGDFAFHVPYSSARFIGTAAQQAMMMMMMGGGGMQPQQGGGQTY